MFNRWLLVGLFSLTIILTGCVVYQPQAVDIPLINKKKDLRIDAGISNLTSANATISYGLTDKVAVQTFGSYQLGERYYFQGAIGLYKKQNIQQVMEWYGGFGYGQGDAYNDANPGNLREIFFFLTDSR